MSDPRNTLQAKFKPAHRYANFGEMLIRMHVKGFRCHTNTVLEVQSPITALCGLNGTGKSTLLQLLAVAYKRPAAAKPYYIKDFLVIGPLDPNPFTDTAEVEYNYLKSENEQQTQKIYRRNKKREWRYPRNRPIREVYFAGIGHYLPRIEKRDFVVRNAKNLQVTGQQDVEQTVKNAVSKILGCQYGAAMSKSVTYSGHQGKIISVNRAGVEYSEAHMGFGEGRTHALLVDLESLPNKSLVLIEEPETSLHPSAQHALAHYLMDVSIRKGHQIFLTTHSEYILTALPAASRVYLLREPSGNVRCIPGVSAAEARSLMTDGNTHALTVLVEDECARAVLRELLRRADPQFLATVNISVGGDADTLAKSVRAIKETNLPVAAVRDADQPEIPQENIFKLPGTKPPEKEILENDHVKQHIQDTYHISVDDFLAGHGGTDHHKWIGTLAKRLNQDERALTVELAKVYASIVSETEIMNLKDTLRESIPA